MVSRTWLIIGLVGIAASQPIQGRQDTRPAKEHQEVTKQTPPTTVPPPASPKPPPCCQPTPSPNQPTPVNKANKWQEAVAPPTWSNWALVFVGIGAIVAALCTLGIIRTQTAHIARQAVSMRRQTTILRKSAEATNRSVELQSVQWVTLKNWRSRLSQPYMLNIEVDLINETSFPLTLRGTTFQVGTAKFEGALDITVVPHAVHTVGCIRQLLQEEYTDYLSDNGTTFGLRGAIRFVGVSGNKAQPFGGLVTTSFSGGTEFSSISEYEQSAKDHYGEESAN